MTEEQRNNPLHGVKLEALLNELVDHYGWEALASAININCFKSNPSIPSSLKFLRKTPWAREKVESFYLYKFKRLPKPDDEQYALPPRDRTVPPHHKPGKPAVIKVSAEAGKKAASMPKNKRPATPNTQSDSATRDPKSVDVWAKWRDKQTD